MMAEGQNSWRIPSGQSQLRKNDIHVWASCIDVAPTTLAALAASLSDGERMRAKKFRFRQHQNRFIARRGLLRAILGRYLQIEPEGVDFNYTPYGKPELTSEFGSSGIHFNISHSEAMALVAVTAIGPVGIDIERIRRGKDAAALLDWCCRPSERELFDNLIAQDKQLAFYNLWTRKEAYLKATGEGITELLREVEVSCLPEEPARLIAVSGDSSIALRWSICNLTPAPEFVAAVAIEAKKMRLQCWEVAPDGFPASVLLPGFSKEM